MSEVPQWVVAYSHIILAASQTGRLPYACFVLAGILDFETSSSDEVQLIWEDTIKL